MINLNSDGLLDLDRVPDVIGLSGWRPDAAVCRILQGSDVRSVPCSGSRSSRSGTKLS